MPLGSSAGRSRKHPTAVDAIARSTPRQRTYQAPPPGEKWVKVTPARVYRVRMVRTMIACAALFGMGALLITSTDQTRFEVIGLCPIVLSVALAGVSKPWREVRTDLVVEDQE